MFNPVTKALHTELIIKFLIKIQVGTCKNKNLIMTQYFHKFRNFWNFNPMKKMKEETQILWLPYFSNFVSLYVNAMFIKFVQNKSIWFLKDLNKVLKNKGFRFDEQLSNFLFESRKKSLSLFKSFQRQKVLMDSKAYFNFKEIAWCWFFK